MAAAQEMLGQEVCRRTLKLVGTEHNDSWTITHYQYLGCARSLLPCPLHATPSPCAPYSSYGCRLPASTMAQPP